MDDIIRRKVNKRRGRERSERPSKRIQSDVRGGTSGRLFEVGPRRILGLPVAVAIVVLAVVVLGSIGIVGALNGWFGGGGSIPEDTFTRGLVGYWSFDEGNGVTVYDSSGNNNNGSISLESSVEEVVNGDCSTLDGWTVDNGTGGGATVIDSGTIKQTQGGTSGYMYTYQTLSLEQGVSYDYSYQGVSENVDGANEASLRIGHAKGQTDVLLVGWGVTGPGTYTGSFIAGSTNVLSLGNAGAAGRIVQHDNVSITRTTPLPSADWIDGKVGGALSFDGVDSYVEVPADSSMNSDAFSVSFWVKFNQLRTQGIIGKDNSGTRWRFFMRSSDNGIELDAMPGEIANVYTSTPSVGEWYHVVGTYDGSDEVKIYMNGVLENTATGISSMNNDQNVSVILGKYETARLDGSMDEVRIYNRALSAEEVRYHYNRGGPVAHWKFDEGSGSTAYDSTENNNDGTLYGEMATSTSPNSGWTTGKHGSALSFDGVDDYVDLGNDSSIEPGTGDFTVGLWMKSNQVADQKYTLFMKGQAGSKGIRLQFDDGVNAGKLLATILDVDSDSVYTVTESTYNDNEWHYVSVVVDRDSSEFKIYVDGSIAGEPASLSAIGDITNATYGWHLGKQRTAYLLYYDGLLDDIRFYSYARTADEIRLDYNAGFAARFGPLSSCERDPGSCMTEGLVGYWNFDEGSGSIAYDASEYSNDGFKKGAGCATGHTDNGDGTCTATFYPDADAESTSVDGQCSHRGGEINGLAWADIRGGAGTNATDDGSAAGIYLRQGSASGWWILARAMTLFHTSALPDNCTITSSTLSVYGSAKGNSAAYDPDINVYSVAPASDTAIAAGDYNSFGTTAYSTTISYASYSTTGYNDFVLNSTGLAAISKTGVSKFGFRDVSADVANVEPSCPYDDISYMQFYTAEKGDPYKPKLEVTYTPAAASISTGWDTGKVGGAAEFNGTDEYIYRSVADFRSSDSLGTVEVWFKTDSTSSKTLFSSSDDADEYRNIEFGINNGYININQRNGVVDSSDSISGGTNIADGQWHHGVFISTGDEYVMYVDGSLESLTVASGSNSGDWFAATSNRDNIYIGAVSRSILVGFFDGLIDEVRIYNRALSAAEVRYHYNRGAPVAHWKFDEGSGSTAYDSTENNNDGILYGEMATSTAPDSGWTTGKHGSALSFDGTDDYVAPSRISNLWQNGNTLSMWLKPADGQPTAYQYFFGGRNVNARTYFYINTDGTIYSSISSDDSNQISFLTNSAVFSNGATNWTHYVVTFNSDYSDGAVYINGQLVSVTKNKKGIVNKATLINSDNETPHIGAVIQDGVVQANKFNGLIDDVRIYNYARTPEQIRQDYNAGLAAHFGPKTDCDSDPGACMTEGLVGYWDFEEGSGGLTSDKSGNGNDGSLENGPEWAGGIVPLSGGKEGGGALQFDGSDDKVVLANALSSLTDAFTVSLWAYIDPADPVLNGNLAYIFDTGNYSTDGFIFFWDDRGLSGQNNGFDLNGTLETSGAVNMVTTNDTITSAGWYFLVARHNKDTGSSIFINGVIEESGDYNEAVVEPTGTPYLGAKDGNDEWFSGLIDEVRIYNRALSAEEIRYHYNRGRPVAHWKFDEGSGSTAYDTTANNNDGTLYGEMATSTSPNSGWTEGKHGSALLFDSINDYVDIESDSSLDIIDNITVSLWVKPSIDSSQFHSEWNYFIYQKGWKYEMGFYGTGGPRFKAWNDSAVSFEANANMSFDAGKWYHVVGLRKDNIVAIYVNGILKKSRYDFEGDLNTGTDIGIGGYDLSINKGFDGLIDDVRVYNYARTPEQIRQDYNAGLSTHFR